MGDIWWKRVVLSPRVEPLQLEQVGTDAWPADGVVPTQRQAGPVREVDLVRQIILEIEPYCFGEQRVAIRVLDGVDGEL